MQVMESSEKTPTTSDAEIMREWMQIEGEYSWARFANAGIPIEQEVGKVMKEGVGGDYWSGFTHSYYKRHHAFKEKFPLRATQTILKQAATFRTIGVCLRISTGLLFEQADQATYDIMKMDRLELVRDMAGLILTSEQDGENYITHTVTSSDACLHNGQVSAATTVIDQAYITLTGAGLIFSQEHMNGDLPAPGISMTDLPEVWDRTR